MQRKLADKITLDKMIMYRRHMDNLRNIQPKVDDKAPPLKPTLLYNTHVMENNAARLTKIDEENSKLVQYIYRTQGKTDCFKPKAFDQRESTGAESIVLNNKAIFKENNLLLTKIRHVKPKIETCATLKKHRKNHYKNLILNSKHPEHLKERINSRNNYDPLIVNAGLPKDVRIKKSNYYLDVVDSTADCPLGRLTIQVYDGVVPVTADNFSALCQRRGRGGYRGTEFFHIVPGVFCLGGDVQYSVGLGGMCAAFDRTGQRFFPDENHLLSHNAPGVLAMYNLDRNENGSQFLLTFKPLTTMDGRYVVFGRVIYGFDTLERIENLGLPSGKPKHKIIIDDCGKIERHK